MINKIAVTNVAKSTPFDNSTNGFVATNVQDAIEEATSSSGFNIPELNSDPVSPTPGDTWVLRNVILPAGSPFGLLLALTTPETFDYRLSYRTLNNTTVRIILT
jgi:hypothetical protein